MENISLYTNEKNDLKKYNSENILHLFLTLDIFEKFNENVKNLIRSNFTNRQSFYEKENFYSIVKQSLIQMHNKVEEFSSNGYDIYLPEE